ncbi:MAG: T9SS type B sorting domain-containing protein, partial [Flavobacterium sp.]
SGPEAANRFDSVKTYTVNGSVIASSIATFNAPGSYTIGIKDDNGCEDFKSYSIEKQLLATATLTKDLYCAAPVNATIDVVITDGVAPYTYQMYLNGSATGASTAVTGSTFTASVATAGSYYFVISDSNTPNCSVTTNTVIVTTPTTPTATPVQTNVSCNGGNDGTITLTPANGITPYTYALTGPVANTTGDATGIYTGLIAGGYSIIVTDAKGCPSAAIPVTITEPAVVAASAIVTPFGCDTANAPQDAIVTITPVGGTAGYTYSFDGGATFQASASFSVNSAQTINYEVRDANGCSVTGTAIVAPYTPPTDMDLTVSPIYCNTPGTVATVTVNGVAGGVPPYTYEIISPASAVTAPSATNSFANLAPETYTIKVTDSNGCSTTKSIIVEEANKISVTAQLINDVYCNGGSTGAVDFTISNYITAGNYTFTLSPNVGIMAQNGDVVSYTALPQGSYTFTVTDGVSGCQASVSNFTISEPAAALSSASVATNINCNNDNATITVIPSGGTAPYKYAVAKTGDPVPAATSFVTNDQLVVDTNNGADVNWTVYVLDSNNCDTNNAQPILLDTNPIIASAIATQCPSATGTYDITVTATGFSTALLYSIDGVGYNANNVITVNAPGVYNVTVKDANGCVSTVTPVTILEPLILTPTVIGSPSCTDGDGVVAVATTGGSGNYIYNIDGGAFGVVTPLTSVASGTHIVGVRDTTTLCEVFTTIDLKPATQITGFALSTTPVTCNGGNDGTITATMNTPAVGVNDNPVYVYSLNGGTPQDSPVFSGLTAGSYTVAVISERGCTATAIISVIEPNPVLVNNVAVSQFICTTGNTSNFATITVDPVTGVTGGSGTYLVYEFIKNGNPVPVQKGISNTYTEFDLSGGSYTVNVYDSNGCMGTYATPITIDPYVGLDKINVINTAITCTNLEDITATAVDASGTTIAGIQYTLTDVSGAVLFPSNTTGNFTGLLVGQYIITALNPTTGCSIQKAHYVNEPNTFDLSVVKTGDVVCYGSNEGAVSITLIDNVTNPTNEAGAFTYTVTGPVPSSGSSATAGPLNLTGLTAGQYTVSATLSNSPFCPVTATFTISQPDAVLSISETHTAITCISGNNDGSISVTATGGWAGGYEYQLENSTGIVLAWSATHDFTNLTADSYTIRVRDTKGCIASTIVSLVIPTPIVITTSPNVLLTCFGDKNGTITATNVTGGQGSNYLYTLNIVSATPVIVSGPQTSPVFTDLGTGTYSITVTDGYNCTATSGTIVISEPTEVIPSLIVSKTQTCLTQTTLTLSAVGGTSPYTYSADANFASVIGSFASSTSFDVPAGNYHYYVKDANGCVSFISNDIKIEPLEPLFVNLELSNAVVKCTGSATGVIIANATGGLGSYQYTLLNGTGTAILAGPQAEDRFENLAAGTYTVKVDSGDCSDTESVIIKQPDTPFTAQVTVIPVMCFGDKSGKIVVTGSGGTGAYVYSISPRSDQYFDEGTFENLAVGFYTILANDENGCLFMQEVEVTGPASPLQVSVTPGSILPEQCIGELNGSFTIDITGGKAPYKVSLDDKKGTYVDVTTMPHAFDNLKGGLHNVYVIDANGCTFDLESVNVPLPVDLTSTVKVEYGCETNTVTVDVIDTTVNPADLDYALDNETGTYQPENVFKDVVPGDHVIYVRHSNGCTLQTPGFKIESFDELSIKVISAGVTEMNVIEVMGVGGKSPYEYSFNGEPFTSSNKYNIYKSGDYEVIVRDQNGCTATIIVPMIYVDVCIPNYFTPNGDGLYDGWGPGCTNIYNNLEFSIFDRYGRVIAKYHYGQKWDGKYNGEELPTGDYWYVLKLNDAKDAREFVGHFTLYR